MSDERDRIEDFFKGRLSQREFPFDEDQWLDLENRLDQHAAIEGASSSNGTPFLQKWITYIVLSLIFLGLSFIAGWYVGQKGFAQRWNEKQTGIDQSTLELSDDLNALDDKNVTLEDGNECVEECADDEYVILTESVPLRLSSEPENVFEQRKKPALSGSYSTPFVNELSRKDQGFMLVAPLSIADSSQQNNLPNALIPLVQENHSMEMIPVFKPGRWAFAAFVAPDFNSTSVSGLFNNLSEAAGVSVDYYAGKRVKITVGFIVNNKRYGAPKEDYTFPKRYGSLFDTAPEYTDAICFMYDIPVNVGYLITRPSSKTQLWLNGGFTSYWLMREAYEYTYDTSDPDALLEWVNKPKAFSILSAINVSLTYQYYLNQHFSVMIEPYFKVPIKGLGYGSVELLSGGVNLGLKYRLGKTVYRRTKAPPDFSQ